MRVFRRAFPLAGWRLLLSLLLWALLLSPTASGPRHATPGPQGCCP